MWAWLKAATTCCGIHRCICHMCRYRCHCCCCLCVSASKANAARGVGVADAWVQLNVAAATTDNRGWSSAFLQLPQLCLLPLATSLRATVPCCRQLALHLIKLQPSAASRMCRIVPLLCCAACGSSSLESRRTIIELCGKWQQKELRCQSESIIKSSSAIDMQRAAKGREREGEKRVRETETETTHN